MESSEISDLIGTHHIEFYTKSIYDEPDPPINYLQHNANASCSQRGTERNPWLDPKPFKISIEVLPPCGWGQQALYDSNTSTTTTQLNEVELKYFFLNVGLTQTVKLRYMLV